MVKKIVALFVIASVVSLQAFDEKIVTTKQPSCLDERIVQFTHAEPINRCCKSLDDLFEGPAGQPCYHAVCIGCGLVPAVVGPVAFGVLAAQANPVGMGVSGAATCYGLSMLGVLCCYNWRKGELRLCNK
jgi:hypothetical protein